MCAKDVPPVLQYLGGDGDDAEVSRASDLSAIISPEPFLYSLG